MKACTYNLGYEPYLSHDFHKTLSIILIPVHRTIQDAAGIPDSGTADF